MPDAPTFDLVSSMIVLDDIDASTINQQDQTFLQQAQLSNLAEIIQGKLALTNSSTDTTREFGRWMIGDHGANSTVLSSLAEQLVIAVPTSLDAQHQAEIADLSSRKDADFDRTYATLGVVDHAQAMALFEQEIANGVNPAVVSFAEQTLPLLQAHYQQAAILAEVQPSANIDSAPVTPKGSEPGQLGDQDAAFVKQAATTNLTEIVEGQRAIAQSDSATVDQYGRWMVADHTAMNLALQTIAGDRNSSVSPETPASHDGASFEDIYLADQVFGHAKALMQFITEAETGQNAALVDYAESALPVLAQHLASAVELRFGINLPDLSADDLGLRDLLTVATDDSFMTEAKLGFARQASDHLLDKLSMAFGHDTPVT
jgi:putative membrane protein